MVTDTTRPLDDTEDELDVDDSRRRSPLPMMLRQLYQTVKSGQQVTFSVFDDDPITGYLAGIDDEHFFVLEPTSDRLKFHKKVIREACCPVFRIHPTPSYKDELAVEEMDRIISPFRSWVLAQVYSRKPRSTERDVA